MIDRRAFVYSGGASALALSLGLQPRKAFAQSSSDMFFQNQFNIIGTAFGNVYNGRTTPNDCYAAAQVCGVVAGYLRQSGLDASIWGGFNSINPSSVGQGSQPDPNVLFSLLQPLVPNLTPAFIAAQASIAQADQMTSLADLQQNGLAFLLDQMAVDLGYFGEALFPDVHPIYICTSCQPPQPPPVPGDGTGDPGPGELIWRGGGGGGTPPPPPPLTKKQKHDRACATDSRIQAGVKTATGALGLLCAAGAIEGFPCVPLLGALVFSAGLHWYTLHGLECGF